MQFLKEPRAEPVCSGIITKDKTQANQGLVHEFGWSWPGHVKKLPVTWELGSFVAVYSGFLQHLKLAIHKLV